MPASSTPSTLVGNLMSGGFAVWQEHIWSAGCTSSPSALKLLTNACTDVGHCGTERQDPRKSSTCGSHEARRPGTYSTDKNLIWNLALARPWHSLFSLSDRLLSGFTWHSGIQHQHHIIQLLPTVYAGTYIPTSKPRQRLKTPTAIAITPRSQTIQTKTISAGHYLLSLLLLCLPPNISQQTFASPPERYFFGPSKTSQT